MSSMDLFTQLEHNKLAGEGQVQALVMPSVDEIKPFYQDAYITLHCGDCRDILPRLDFTADLLVTDPPYGQDWQSGRRKVKLDKLDGDQDTRTAVEGIAAALKKLRRGRHTYIFGRYEFEDLPLCESSELIWDKELFNGGNLEIAWGNAHEYIQFAVHEISKANRGKGYGRLAARIRRGSVLRVPRLQSVAVTKHPTEKPVRLIRELIESSSSIGETVLDPFAGTGSTLIAARIKGRRAIGVEVKKAYCEEAARRCLNWQREMEAA